jgi:hypothetical protein
MKNCTQGGKKSQFRKIVKKQISIRLEAKISLDSATFFVV